MKLTKEDIKNYATEDEKKILEGNLHKMEYANLPDRELGLRAHLESNFFPRLPRWVQDRILEAFKKHWAGEWSVEDVVADLTEDILRDDEAVFRYFDSFFDFDEASGEEVWEQ